MTYIVNKNQVMLFTLKWQLESVYYSTHLLFVSSADHSKNINMYRKHIADSNRYSLFF